MGSLFLKRSQNQWSLFNRLLLVEHGFVIRFRSNSLPASDGSLGSILLSGGARGAAAPERLPHDFTITQCVVDREKDEQKVDDKDRDRHDEGGDAVEFELVGYWPLGLA